MRVSEQELLYLLGIIATVLLPPLPCAGAASDHRHAADEHQMDRRALELLRREHTAEIVATRWPIDSEYAQFVFKAELSLSRPRIHSL